MKKKITLKKYYKTKHWKQLHYDFALGADACCEICGAKRWGLYKIGKNKGKRKPKQENHLHLHHKHYRTLFKETRKDFMLICESCHKLGHLLERMKNKHAIYKVMHEDFVNKTGWSFKRKNIL